MQFHQVKIIKYCKNSLQALVSQSRNLPVTIIYRQQIVIIIQLLDQPSSISCRTMLHLRIKHRRISNSILHGICYLRHKQHVLFSGTVYGIAYPRSALSFLHFLTIETWASFFSSASLVAWSFWLFLSLVTLPLSSVSLDYAASLALPALSSDAESLAFC